MEVPKYCLVFSGLIFALSRFILYCIFSDERQNLSEADAEDTPPSIPVFVFVLFLYFAYLFLTLSLPRLYLILSCSVSYLIFILFYRRRSISET